MNLLPMLVAFVFVRISGEMTGIWDIVKAAFRPQESWRAYAAALAAPLVYYGGSSLLGNVTFTGSPFSAAIAYFPWTLLQGGLEKVGWRWYLQSHIATKRSFALKMLVVSLIWFVWHLPLYRLPWVPAGSSNFLVFFLILLLFSFFTSILTVIAPLYMYRTGEGAWKTFLRIIHLVREQPGACVRFFLFMCILNVLIMLGVSVFLILGCCCLCGIPLILSGIPYLWAVLYLPVLVFSQYFILYFCAEMNDDFNVFPPPQAGEGAPSPTFFPAFFPASLLRNGAAFPISLLLPGQAPS